MFLTIYIRSLTPAPPFAHIYSMTRARRVYSDQFPYHVTARCINKEWFQLPLKDVWTIFNNHLYFISIAFNVRIHSFVLMSNHFHLLLTTPQGNINEVMRYFMTETSRDITLKTGRINQTYGGPYFSSLITKDIHFHHVYKYIYRNPVEALLVTRAEEYEFSTLPTLLGLSKSIIPLCADELLFNDVERTLSWINTNYKEGVKDNIRQALRKNTFQIPKSRASRTQNTLEIHPS